MIKIVKDLLTTSETIYDNKIDISIFDYIKQNIDKEVKLGYKINVFVNNSKLEKKEYTYIIEEDDDIEIVVSIEAAIVIPLLINIVISLVLSWLMTPDNEKIQDKGASVYEFDVTSIVPKKDGVVPEIFGTHTTFPNLISPVLHRYENQTEVVYITSVVGVGNYTFDDIYLNKENMKDTFLYSPSLCPTKKDSVVTCFSDAQDWIKIYKIKGKSISSVVNDINYRYVIKEHETYQNFDLIEFDPNLEGKWTTPIALSQKGEVVDKFEVDVLFNGGLYRVDDDGDSHAATISFFYRVYKYDTNGNKVYVLNKTFSKTYQTGERLRFTIEENLLDKNNIHYLEFSNNTRRPGTSQNISNGYKIRRLKSFFVENDYLDDNITYAVFKVRTGVKFDDNNKLNLSLKVSRDIYKMADVIKYIWNSAGFNPLELKDIDEKTLGKTVNGILDVSEPIYAQINKILRGQRFILIPTLTGFKIKEEKAKPFNTYLYDKKNIKKGSLEISYTVYDTTVNDSFKTVFIDETGDKQEYTYPETGIAPEEIRIFGTNSMDDAIAHAKIGYKKRRLQNKVIKFETEYVGYIPEIEDKIQVVNYQLNDSYSTEIIGINDSGYYIVDNEVLLTGNSYCIVRLQNQPDNNYIPIVGEGWTRELNIPTLNLSPYDIETNKIAIIIGEEVEFIDEFIVQNINSKDLNTIEIIAQNYNPEIYEV